MIKEAISKLVEELAGKDVVSLFELLIGKENVSEIKLSEKMQITVNQVRNMLYRLYDHNLVSFTRKKDKVKGWYIYYWTFDGKRAIELIKEVNQEKLTAYNEQLKREKTTEFFICPEDPDIRFSLETALEHNFQCPDCEGALQKEDNSKKVAKIEKDIEELQKEIQQSHELEYKKPKSAKKKSKKKATKKKTSKKKKAKKKTTKKKSKKKPKKKATKKKTSKKKKRNYLIEKRKSKPKKKKTKKKTTKKKSKKKSKGRK